MNILNRLQEPSTWAALTALVAAFRTDVSELVPLLGDAVIAVGVFVTAAIAVFKKDPGSPE